MSGTTVYKGAFLPTVAGDAGLWGTEMNTQTFVTFDSALGGYAALSVSNVNVTLSTTQAGMALLRVSGTLTGSVQITTSTQGFQFIENLTTGSYALTITNGVGTPLTLTQGFCTPVIFDATNGARQSGVSNLINDGSGNLIVPYPNNVSAGNSLSVGANITLAGYEDFAEISTPASPSAGNLRVYAKSGDVIAALTSAGVEKQLFKTPTVQTFTSGSGTYTPASGVTYIEVEMVAGGGGQGTGGRTSLGSWTCIGGSNGYAGGGTGGANGTGTLLVRISGQGGGWAAGTYPTFSGGPGGSNPLGYGGQIPWASSLGAGGYPGSGYGWGGSGTTGNLGAGSGEYAKFIVTNPDALSYSVGGGGSSGPSCIAGGGGIIIIKEFYA